MRLITQFAREYIGAVKLQSHDSRMTDGRHTIRSRAHAETLSSLAKTVSEDVVAKSRDCEVESFFKRSLISKKTLFLAASN